MEVNTLRHVIEVDTALLGVVRKTDDLFTKDCLQTIGNRKQEIEKRARRACTHNARSERNRHFGTHAPTKWRHISPLLHNENY